MLKKIINKMKITAQEEYGLRILLRIARNRDPIGLTISQIGSAEGLTTHNVAKLCRILRQNGYIKSTRGQTGGYLLAEHPAKIIIGKVLEPLGGKLYDSQFCSTHAGIAKLCTNSVDCSIRSLWNILQMSMDNILYKLTLNNLIGNEGELNKLFHSLTETYTTENKKQLKQSH